MVALLVIFTMLITGYNYVTNADHVRQMAEDYLSGLIGGRVTVHSATLSIFEGLRLEGVAVYVDDGRQPDSLIFSAQTFLLTYDPAKIIRGQIEAGQIIAQKPHVHLTENPQTHEWNFFRLVRGKRFKPAPSLAGGPPLPAVMVRNARVEISEVRDGQLIPIGYEALDGQLAPLPEPGTFRFDLQARGSEGVGPWATGRASIAGGPVDVVLHDFDFGRDVRAMLWEQPREFWERHHMSGRIDALRVHFQPEPEGKQAPFKVEMTFGDINATVPPTDWLNADEIRHRATMRDGVAVMQSMYRLAGCGPAPAMAALTSGDMGPAMPASAPASAADAIAALVGPSSFELQKGSGTFVFTNAGVELQNVTGRIEGNAFLINARLDGYSPEAPFSVTLRSLDNETLQIPSTPRYLTSLPPMVRDIYTMVQADGRCTMKVKVQRAAIAARPMIEGQVDIVDGVFSSVFFPYPLRQTTGRITFGYDKQARADFVHVVGMRGRGVAGGPNQDSWVTLSADVGPLGPEYPDPNAVIRVAGTNVSSEPSLFKAFPPEVREPLKIFDADHTGNFPTFHGDFSTTVLHRAGWAWRWSFDTDLHLDDASGKIVGFPYFLDHVAADVQVRDGYCDIINAHARRGEASLRVDGRVNWRPMTPPDTPPQDPNITSDVHVKVTGLPIDKELLAALPPTHAIWIKRIGLGGKLDVEGRVFQGLPDPARPGAVVDPMDVRFDLGISLHDGTLWPANGTFGISDASGTARLTPDSIEIHRMHGRRGAADFSGDGAIRWPAGAPELAFRIKADDLALDASLYAMLPADARDAWDQIQPHGVVDADMSLRAVVDDDGKPIAFPGPASLTLATRPKTLPEQAAAPAAFSNVPFGFNGVFRPKGMSVTINALPYRLDDVNGVVTISPGKVTIENVTARHGGATLTASGTGVAGDRETWTLRLSGKNLKIDPEFRKAMPATVISLLDAVKLSGNVDFDFPQLVYRSTGLLSGPPAPSVQLASTSAPPLASVRPASPQDAVDIDLTSVIALKKCALDLGVPMTDAWGTLHVGVTVRDGKLSTVNGDLENTSVMASGRRLTDITLHIAKPADRPELFIEKAHGILADGQLAGEAHLSFPDDGPTRYLLSIVLRNADIKEVAPDSDKNLRGELTASLTLEGSWGSTGAAPASRRGRGDVLVSGKELYHLPLLMGLFQVTNLSLPIATPFKLGSARYSVEGQVINFEHIELKSDNMSMVGGGSLDFKTKKVHMSFTTDNPNGFKLPFINDFWNNARGELMRINVRGTIQEPKVQANAFGTFTTTVDEVFRGEGKKEGR
jgi:hypothetical protein